MEFFDLYSANRQPLGRRVLRGEPIPNGEYHIVVQVMTINRKGEILLTQRVPQKTSGGKWECSGGCAISGETSRSAAVRELYEETGIRAFESELFLEWSLTTDSMLRDFYILVKDAPLSSLHLQAAEVCAAKWVTYERLCEMVRLGQTTRTIARWLENRSRELKYLTSRATPSNSYNPRRQRYDY
ncbi:MAG: NUDIX domain-containing protein [Oscillospiraceae bacterium]